MTLFDNPFFALYSLLCKIPDKHRFENETQSANNSVCCAPLTPKVKVGYILKRVPTRHNNIDMTGEGGACADNSNTKKGQILPLFNAFSGLLDAKRHVLRYSH